MAAIDEQHAVAAAIERCSGSDGALLPLLHEVHEALGYIPPHYIADIARALNLSTAEVHGVISFYHDFRTEPGGRHRVQICRSEACQAVGAREVEAHAVHTLGVSLGQTTEDGAVTLDAVYCLGNCACGPSVRIDDRIHGRVDAKKMEALLVQCRSETAT